TTLFRSGSIATTATATAPTRAAAATLVIASLVQRVRGVGLRGRASVDRGLCERLDGARGAGIGVARSIGKGRRAGRGRDDGGTSIDCVAFLAPGVTAFARAASATGSGRSGVASAIGCCGRARYGAIGEVAIVATRGGFAFGIAAFTGGAFTVGALSSALRAFAAATAPTPAFRAGLAAGAFTGAFTAGAFGPATATT